MKNSNNIILTINNHIATLILNRPDKHNAFDAELIKNLIDTFKNLDKDPNVRVVILTAAGKDFCAGADIEWMKNLQKLSKSENKADAKQLANLFQTLNTLSKPTIALIQGAVAGGGNGLVACCDIAIASPDANFCLREVKLGIIPASIGPYVIAAMGSRNARRYFLTAEKFSAEAAYRMGLIHQIVPPAELQNQGETLANTLLKNGPQALTAAKKLIQRCCPMDEKLLEETVRLIAEIRVSAEAQEGFQAFLDKRPPRWTS